MLTVIAGIVIAIGLIVLIRSRVVRSITVTVRQVPAVVAQLAQSGRDGAWAVFMFTRDGAPHVSDDTDLNLQYSVEQGRMGLEWVRLIPGNVAAADEFHACVTRHGFAVAEREVNRVPYLRVEGTGLDTLGMTVLRECFGLRDDTVIDLVPDGFTWRP